MAMNESTWLRWLSLVDNGLGTMIFLLTIPLVKPQTAHPALLALNHLREEYVFTRKHHRHMCVMRFLLWKGAELNFHWRTATMRHTFHCHQQWTDTANAVNSLQNSQRQNRQTWVEKKTQTRASKNKYTRAWSHSALTQVYTSVRIVCALPTHTRNLIFHSSSLQMFGGLCKTKPAKTVFLKSRNGLPLQNVYVLTLH